MNFIFKIENNLMELVKGNLPLYLVLNLIYYFTSCIGVWRSSQKYKGNKILSFLARLIVVIGISTTILELKTILTIIYSF